MSKVKTDPRQTAYEKIRAYFTRPDAKLAKDEWGDCYYRKDDRYKGDACAIGCLLTNEWIKEHGGVKEVNEAGSIHGLLKNFPDASKIVGERNTPLFAFLANTQEAHDQHAVSVEDFVLKLDYLAKEANLSVLS